MLSEKFVEMDYHAIVQYGWVGRKNSRTEVRALRLGTYETDCPVSRRVRPLGGEESGCALKTSEATETLRTRPFVVLQVSGEVLRVDEGSGHGIDRATDSFFVNPNLW